MPVAHPKAIFWEYGRQAKQFAYAKAPYDRSPHLAVRYSEWKLLVNADGTQTQLYNMETDPNETKDCTSQQPKTTEHLRAMALAWRRALPKYTPPKDQEK